MPKLAEFMICNRCNAKIHQPGKCAVCGCPEYRLSNALDRGYKARERRVRGEPGATWERLYPSRK